MVGPLIWDRCGSDIRLTPSVPLRNGNGGNRSVHPNRRKLNKRRYVSFAIEAHARFNLAMTEPWGPHDVGGRTAGALDLGEQENAHWEWQIDAMVRLALTKGLISDFAELRDGIERLSPEDYEQLSYYERWAKSLAFTLVAKGVVTEQQIIDKAAEIRRRQEGEKAS